MATVLSAGAAPRNKKSHMLREVICHGRTVIRIAKMRGNGVRENCGYRGSTAPQVNLSVYIDMAPCRVLIDLA